MRRMGWGAIHPNLVPLDGEGGQKDRMGWGGFPRPSAIDPPHDRRERVYRAP